jgi:hypothetical protein
MRSKGFVCKRIEASIRPPRRQGSVEKGYIEMVERLLSIRFVRPDTMPNVSMRQAALL